MKVFLPADLRYSLSATTTYDVWLQKQVKEKFYKLLKIQHHEGRALLKLQRDNKQKLQELSHDLNVAEIDLLKM